MGLISFFKKMFSSTITMPVRRKDALVVPFSSGYTTINIGQKLVVESGWYAAIVAKDAVLDIFPEGKHTLSLAYLPKTAKALRLDRGKVKKHGMVAEVILPKKFNCDLYFINMAAIEGRNWETDFIRVREKDKAKFKYKVFGKYCVQASDPQKVLELFLIDWGKIRTGKAVAKLDRLVGEMCTDLLWRAKLGSKTKLTEYDFANMALKPPIYKNFAKYGLCVYDMAIERVVYPENFRQERFVEAVPEIDHKLQESLPDNTLLEQAGSVPALEGMDFIKLDKQEKMPELTSEEKASLPFREAEEEKQPTFSGTQLSTEEVQKLRLCRKCDTILPVSCKFCPECGREVEKPSKKEKESENV